MNRDLFGMRLKSLGPDPSGDDWPKPRGILVTTPQTLMLVHRIPLYYFFRLTSIWASEHVRTNAYSIGLFLLPIYRSNFNTLGYLFAILAKSNWKHPILFYLTISMTNFPRFLPSVVNSYKNRPISNAFFS